MESPGGLDQEKPVAETLPLPTAKRIFNSIKDRLKLPDDQKERIITMMDKLLHEGEIQIKTNGVILPRSFVADKHPDFIKSAIASICRTIVEQARRQNRASSSVPPEPVAPPAPVAPPVLPTRPSTSSRKPRSGCRSTFVGLFLGGFALAGGVAAANSLFCQSGKEGTTLSTVNTGTTTSSFSTQNEQTFPETKTPSSPSVVATASALLPNMGFGLLIANSATPAPAPKGTVFNIPTTIITPPPVLSLSTSTAAPSAPTVTAQPSATIDAKKPVEAVVALSAEAKKLFEAHPEFDASDIDSKIIKDFINSFAASERLKALLQDGKIKLLPGTSLLGQIFNAFHEIALTPEQHAYFYFLEGRYFVGEHASKNPKSAYAKNNEAALEFYKFVNKGLEGIAQKAGKTASLDEHLQLLVRLAIRPFLSDFSKKNIYGVFAAWSKNHPQVLAEMGSPYGTTWKYTDTNGFAGVSATASTAKIQPNEDPVVALEKTIKSNPEVVTPSGIIDIPVSPTMDYSPPPSLRTETPPSALDDSPWYEEHEKRHPDPTVKKRKKAPPKSDDDLPPEYQNMNGNGSFEKSGADLPTKCAGKNGESSCENAQAETFISAICANLQPPKGKVVYTYIAELCKKHFGTENYSHFAPLIKALRASKGTCFANVWRTNDKGKRVKRGGDRSFALSDEFKARFREIAEKNFAGGAAEPFSLVSPKMDPFELVARKHDAFPLVTEAAEPFELVEEPILLVNKKPLADTINATRATVDEVIKIATLEQSAIPVKMVDQDSFAADADPFPSTSTKRDSGVDAMPGASKVNDLFMPEPEPEPVPPDEPDEPLPPDESEKKVEAKGRFLARVKSWFTGERLAA